MKRQNNQFEYGNPSKSKGCSDSVECSKKQVHQISDVDIHGLKYIVSSSSPLLQRLIWLVAVGAGIVISAILIQESVVSPLQTSPLFISFDEEDITVDRIPFPAVTICPSSRRKEDKFQELNDTFLEKFAISFTDEGKDRQKIKELYGRAAALNYLNGICTGTQPFSEEFITRNISRISLPEDQGGLNETLDMKYISQFFVPALYNCDETIRYCLWAGQPVDCKLLFYPLLTDYGICCAFNMMPPEILRNNYRGPPTMEDNDTIERWRKWDIDKHLVDEEFEVYDEHDVPKHQRKAGMSSGLSVVLNPSSLRKPGSKCESSDGTGFKVLLHSPIVYPRISQVGTAIEPRTETFIRVDAKLTLKDPIIDSYSQKIRKCYFRQEYPLKFFNFYSQRNCIDECMSNKIYKKCKCIAFFMPQQAKQRRFCTNATEYECFRKAPDEFRELEKRKSLCPKCLPSCTPLRYSMKATSLPLRDDIELWKSRADSSENTSDTDWNKQDATIVHMFFSKETVETRRLRALYGLKEILGSAGGLLGLTLGLSGISVVEICYVLFAKFCLRKSPTRSSLKSSKPNQASLKPSSASEGGQLAHSRSSVLVPTTKDSDHAFASWGNTVINPRNRNRHLHRDEAIKPSTAFEKKVIPRYWILD